MKKGDAGDHSHVQLLAHIEWRLAPSARIRAGSRWGSQVPG